MLYLVSASRTRTTTHCSISFMLFMTLLCSTWFQLVGLGLRRTVPSPSYCPRWGRGWQRPPRLPAHKIIFRIWSAFLTTLKNSEMRYGSGSTKMMRLLAAPAPQHCTKVHVHTVSTCATSVSRLASRLGNRTGIPCLLFISTCATEVLVHKYLCY
jgi:hypothetical protein